MECGAETDAEAPQRPPIASNLYILLGISGALGGFSFGYNTTSISGALLQLKRPDSSPLCPGLADRELSTREQEHVASSIVLGAFFGSLVAGQLADGLGRRGSLLLSSSLLWIGCVLAAMSVGLYSMICARLITGLGVGLASHTVPMYIAECAPKESRGSLCFLNTLMIVSGNVVAGVFSAVHFQRETAGGWRYILGLGALPAGLMCLGFLMLPESPRYLMSNDWEDLAREALAGFRGRSATDPALVAELIEMTQGVKEESRLQQSRLSFHAYWLNPRIRRALLLGCGLQFLQQWSGINTILYYGATILQNSESSLDETTCFTVANQRSVNATIYFAASEFASIFVCFWCVESLGRRPLMLVSLVGTFFSLVAIGFIFHAEIVDSTRVVVFVIVYMVLYGIGLSPVPWTVNAEIYPMAVRGTCMAISTSTNWLNNFLVAETYLSLASLLSTHHDARESHPDGIFWLYASIMAVGLPFMWFKLPETKGRALEDMDALFVSPDEYTAA
eukprot:TRINITY_DN64750_c0_g1_i1.p1 TRINITY_DN64750_c0_g1~~TRINITY_DN64750_c0_g1_i1.p1  ORF type:complete len:521 (+),score=69.31 TRINITY_DN64750_c0_g1_i1:47-1564(+)